jgi:hypothetical protein
MNAHDCGLFGIGFLLHIVEGIPIHDTLFSQDDISNFRKTLFKLLENTDLGNRFEKDPKSHLSRAFIMSFFPKLVFFNQDELLFNDEYLQATKDNISNYFPRRSPRSLKKAADPHSSSASATTMMEQESTSPFAIGDPVSPTQGCTTKDEENIEAYVDVFFNTRFVTSGPAFKSLDELETEISAYQNESGTNLKIRRSDITNTFREYVCNQHNGCLFCARFGPRKSDKQIILKKHCLEHKGQLRPGFAKDGRKLKSRKKGLLQATIDEVAMMKDGEPRPKDVMKAAGTTKGINASYMDSYRAIAQDEKYKKFNDHESFQLVIPYLKKLKKNNPGSHIAFKCNDNHLNKIFICVGFMNSNLRSVRPVMSLDAAHLRSKWKGTLFIASVKTALDEIYPVAIGISSENEDYKGWFFFW